MAECCCGSDKKIDLIYSCSGAANTGYLADRAARRMMKEGTGKMTCLAAVEAELSGFTQSAKAACRNIVIDGCKVSCGKKIFERLGLPFTHIIITDFGVEKGKTEITEAAAAEAADKISSSLSAKVC